MSHVIGHGELLRVVDELRATAVEKLIAADSHDASERLRGELRAYTEIVYKLIEEPRLEAERTLNGADNE